MLPDTTKTTGVKLKTNFILVWAEGSSTPAIHEDDLYLVSGTSSGFSSGGLEFSSEIKDSLYNYVDCFWISRGVHLITIPSAEFRTGDIDYISEDGCFNQIHFYFNENLFYDAIK